MAAHIVVTKIVVAHIQNSQRIFKFFKILGHSFEVIFQKSGCSNTGCLYNGCSNSGCYNSGYSNSDCSKCLTPKFSAIESCRFLYWNKHNLCYQFWKMPQFMKNNFILKCRNDVNLYDGQLTFKKLDNFRSSYIEKKRLDKL